MNFENRKVKNVKIGVWADYDEYEVGKVKDLRKIDYQDHGDAHFVDLYWRDGRCDRLFCVLEVNFSVLEGFEPDQTEFDV